MIKKILFPTDFSDHAEKCIDYIIKMKDCGIEEVVLLHVTDYRIINETDIMFEEAIDETQVIAECKTAAEKNLKKIADRLNKEGIKTKSLIRVGSPFAGIIKAEKEMDVSMIIMGHRGRSLTEEILLGSTAEKVTRKSKRPVLLIK